MTLARMADLPGHEWDAETFYCKRCGAGRMDIQAGTRNPACLTAPNLIAVSHVISRRRLDRLLGQSDRK